MKAVLIVIVLAAALYPSLLQAGPGDKVWLAPQSAKSMDNPLQGNAAATAEGKKIFNQFCAVCHGDKGKGDGIGGTTLNPKPRNFSLPKTQDQADGEFFWKLTEGRPPMASYKNILTATQRWQLVNYIRTFKK